jgi:hypothetical protein
MFVAADLLTFPRSSGPSVSTMMRHWPPNSLMYEGGGERSHVNRIYKHYSPFNREESLAIYLGGPSDGALQPTTNDESSPRSMRLTVRGPSGAFSAVRGSTHRI